MRLTAAVLGLHLLAGGVAAQVGDTAQVGDAAQAPVGPLPVEGSGWMRELADLLWILDPAGASPSASPLLAADHAAALLCRDVATAPSCARLMHEHGVPGQGPAYRFGGALSAGFEGEGLIAPEASAMGRAWGARVRGGVRTSDRALRLDHASAAYRAHERLSVLAGFDAAGLAPEPRRGIVRSSERPLGYGALAIHPAPLPGFLEAIGPVSAFSSIGRLSRHRYGSPKAWIWLSRLTLQPAGTLELGVNRSVVFGGEGPGVLDPSFERVGRMLLGMHNTEVRDGHGFDFDDQVISFDVRWRLPGVPAALYGEWGAEDNSGALGRVPGLRFGAQAAWGGPLLGVAGIERTSFARSGGGNPPWYQHFVFGPYVDAGVALGHPLGGHGSELLAFALVNDARALWRIRGELFWREREEENIFGPLGSSTGGALEVEVAPLPSLRFSARMHAELFDGVSPDRSGIQVAARYITGPLR